GSENELKIYRIRAGAPQELMKMRNARDEDAQHAIIRALSKPEPSKPAPRAIHAGATRQNQSQDCLILHFLAQRAVLLCATRHQQTDQSSKYLQKL
ncbi:hypothetical protein A2U01_0072443, partial [Trifolium medium]|nr:hypothetical protein [Trifolium medium]